MAETVEKFFNEKISTMPPEEYEIIKGGKSGSKPAISKTGGDLIEPATKKAKPIDKPQTIAAGKFLSKVQKLINNSILFIFHLLIISFKRKNTLLNFFVVFYITKKIGLVFF